MPTLRIVTDHSKFSGKTVLVRIDTDVDIKDGKVLDDTRLKASLETVNYILQKEGAVILLGHLGRPEEKFQISNAKSPIPNENKKFTLAPVAHWFGKYYQRKLSEVQIGGFPGWQIAPKLSLIENLRFYKGEEDPSTRSGQELIKALSGLGHLYVDDAFAVAHRDHASITGIPKILPSFAGIHFEREVKTLTEITRNPKRPLAVLIGGAKIETKLPLVERMHSIADFVLVGGEIAEQDKILIRVQHEKIKGTKGAVIVADLTEDRLDITPKSVENFAQILQMSATIVWNGPMGLTGKSETTEIGTKLVAEAIVATSAYKIVGGGDTLSYLQKINLLGKFNFVSTGGGAMLELLAGKELPGVVALEKH